MQAYPTHLVKMIHLADRTPVTLRPIRATDEVIEQQFVRGLSDEARYYRFMDMLRELSPHMLRQMTHIDYHDQMALIAVTKINGRETEIAVGRYVVFPGTDDCEFAIVVGDKWQGKGIATALMRQLIKSARARGLKKMIGEVLTTNSKMLHFVATLGFHSRMAADDPTQMQVIKDLRETADPA